MKMYMYMCVRESVDGCVKLMCMFESIINIVCKVSVCMYMYMHGHVHVYVLVGIDHQSRMFT